MLYEVIAYNHDGVDGLVQLSSGKKVATNHPLNDQPGFNPEELIALAWSTCLNATIKALLETRKRKELASKVEVKVQLKKDETAPGYFFQVDAQASIDQLSLAEAEEIVELAHQRCPVSKLISQASSLTIQTVPFSS